MRITKYCLLMAIFLVIAFAMSDSNAQESGTVPNQPSPIPSQSSTYKVDTGTRMFSVKTIGDLLKLCEEIGWFLILNFVVGALVLSQKWLVLRREKKDDEKIPLEQFRIMVLDDIKKMLTQAKENPGTEESEATGLTAKVPLLKKIFAKRKTASAFLLLQRLYRIFEAKKSADDFGAETANFIQNLKDQFNTFTTRMAYLSDTAGGLGLLGTVWGMFMVFFKGTMVMDDILHGMGVALATTIVGLIISIILNTFTTVVSNKFDRHLDFISKMSTVFHERMIAFAEQPAVGPIIYAPQPLPTASLPVGDQRAEVEPVVAKAAPQPEVPARKTVGAPAEIKVLSGNNQSAEVNTQLPEPILVEIVDSQGNPLEGVTVVFTAEEGAGWFANQNRIQKILTNEEGRAQTHFLLGKKAGEKTIHISVEGGDCRPVVLLAIARPAPAIKFVELRGNYQIGSLGRRLPEPLAVAIRDKYDNPISKYEVNFHLRKGTGRFQDSQNTQLTTLTNEDGMVEVYFIFDNNRGAREIVAEAKKVEPSKIEFEVFAV